MKMTSAQSFYDKDAGRFLKGCDLKQRALKPPKQTAAPAPGEDLESCTCTNTKSAPAVNQSSLVCFICHPRQTSPKLSLAIYSF